MKEILGYLFAGILLGAFLAFAVKASDKEADIEKKELAQFLEYRSITLLK